jgi:uncharacterized protein (DUF1330 family)
MTAYVVFIRESPVHDPAEMEKYRSMGRDNSQFVIKPLAVYGALEGIEGQAPDGCVVLEFPSVEEAKAWYYSPIYQAAAQHRMKAADYRGFIVEGFKPPGA